MSDIKMKPCPFCGSAPVQSSSNNGEGFMDAWIECENDKCDINPSVSDPNLYTAIEMWNKRNNDTLVAQNLALKAALAEAVDYLNTNKLTSIASGSKLHTKFNDVLEGVGDE